MVKIADNEIMNYGIVSTLSVTINSAIFSIIGNSSFAVVFGLSIIVVGIGAIRKLNKYFK